MLEECLLEVAVTQAAGAEVREPYEATYAFFYSATPATPSDATPAG